MVIAYSGGQQVDAADDSQKMLADFAGLGHAVDMWSADGKYLGKFIPPTAGAKEPIIPWEPDVTREELDRRIRESPRTTLDEFWKKMGVK